MGFKHIKPVAAVVVIAHAVTLCFSESSTFTGFFAIQITSLAWHVTGCRTWYSARTLAWYVTGSISWLRLFDSFGGKGSICIHEDLSTCHPFGTILFTIVVVDNTQVNVPVLHSLVQTGDGVDRFSFAFDVFYVFVLKIMLDRQHWLGGRKR